MRTRPHASTVVTCNYCGVESNATAWSPTHAAVFVVDSSLLVLEGDELPVHMCETMPTPLRALALRLAGEWFAACRELVTDQ